MRLRSDGRRHLATAVDAPSMIPKRTTTTGSRGTQRSTGSATDEAVSRELAVRHGKQVVLAGAKVVLGAVSLLDFRIPQP
jgi:hypothetical protein